MKTAFAILLAAAVGTVAAEPHTVVTPCTACKGERSLSVTPPNLGHEPPLGRETQPLPALQGHGPP